MKINKKMFWVLAGAMGVLAMMGLVLAWKVVPDMDVGDGLFFLKRQTLWALLGVAAAVLSTLVSWRWWMKAAPWIAAGWAVAFVASAACPLVDGWHRYLVLGPVKLDTWTLSWPVGALALAWLQNKLPISTRMLLGSIVVSAALCLTGSILSNANRVARVHAFFTGRDLPCAATAEAVTLNAEQSQLRTALCGAKWVGASDAAVGWKIRYPHTSGVASASAVRFGKVFPFGALALFGVVAVGLAALGRRMADPSKRLYLLVYGMTLVVPAALSVCECARLVPLLRFCVPLVSFGGAACLSAGWGLGVVFAALREEKMQETYCGKR